MSITKKLAIDLAIIFVSAPFFAIYAWLSSAKMFPAIFSYFVVAFCVAKIVPVVFSEVKNRYLPNRRIAMRSIKKLRPIINRPDSANLLYSISVVFLLIAFAVFIVNPKGWGVFIWQFFAFSFLFLGTALDLFARLKVLIFSRLARFIKIIGSFVFGTFFAYASSVFSDWMINDVTHLSGKDFPALFALLSAWMTPLLWVMLLQATLTVFSIGQFVVFITGQFLGMIGEQFIGAISPVTFRKLKYNFYRIRYGERPIKSRSLLKTIGTFASPFGIFLIVFVLSFLTSPVLGFNEAIKNSLAKFIVFSEYHSSSDCANIKGLVKMRVLEGGRVSVASYDSNGMLKFQSEACVLPGSN